jgi:hypothetical protein
MDKKISGLLGAVAALGTFGSAEAAPAPAPADALQASSYAELLEPIPNAGALLQAIDEQAPAKASENIQLAQYYYDHHHHHHHHHSFYPRGYYQEAPVVVVPRYRRYHHHHHHHHHHSFYRRYDEY